MEAYRALADAMWKDTKHPAKQAMILLRGNLISSDHMASAHVGELPKPQLSNPEQIIAKLKLDEPYAHQTECRNIRGSAVLMAPTGSGKTEAALLWAVSQGASRLYYTLPFQASMNAMEKRLTEDEKNEQDKITREAPFKGQVGLEHSRSTLAYYRRLFYENENADPKQTKAAKCSRISGTELLSCPCIGPTPLKALTVSKVMKPCSPIAMAFVFDEIHAYDGGAVA